MSVIANLNDTIAMNDTIVVKIIKSMETCLPVINEVETNCSDVWIVVAICVTVVLVVGLVAWVLYTWISGKNKLQMAELKQRERASEVDFQKQEQEIELRKLDAEIERNQKKQENELKNKKTEQDLTLEKWDAEHKKEENQLHRERYQQETEIIKLDAELERKIRDKESGNEKK